MSTFSTLDLPSDVTDLIATQTALADSLTLIEQDLFPILSAPLNHMISRLTPLEAAKMYAAIAYTINTAFFMYLRTQGIVPTTHPVKKELDRVKRYIQKISDAQKSATSTPTPPHAPTPPTQRVDKGAAARFIKHALSGNDDGEEGQTKQQDNNESSDEEQQEAHQTPAKSKPKSTSTSKSTSSSTSTNRSSGNKRSSPDAATSTSTSKKRRS